MVAFDYCPKTEMIKTMETKIYLVEEKNTEM